MYKDKWAASGDDPHGQGDPEEQYSWILKVLSEKLPKRCVLIRFPYISLVHQADFGNRAYRLLEATNHLVTDSCIKCNSCGYVSKTVGHITGPISVPLKPRIRDGNLSHYLKAYMREKITDYKCEKCHDKSVSHDPGLFWLKLLLTTRTEGKRAAIKK